MRKHELLTEHERRQLLSIPENRDGLARLYTFEPDDLDLIRDRREDHNKLGVALQLCTLRHPGVPLARSRLRWFPSWQSRSTFDLTILPAMAFEARR